MRIPAICTATFLVAIGLSTASCATATNSGVPKNVSPWVASVTPQRTLYVSPDGAGSGLSPGAPMSFRKAIEAALPGDLYWLLEGRYTGGVNLTCEGNPRQPIVYRAMPGKRVTIVGAVNVSGAHTWLWGLEFIDPELLKPGIVYRYEEKPRLVIRVGAPDAHIINNIIHNCAGGIGGWTAGPGQVYYGNIIYGIGGDTRSAEKVQTNVPAYTDNDYDKDGYKYWVQNMFFDAKPGLPGTEDFLAYAEEGNVSGFYLKQNLFANGQMIIGSTERPPHHTVVAENCFYRAKRARFGYEVPVQVEFRDNYLAETSLDAVQFPGAGGKKLVMPLPSIVTGNEIYAPTLAGSHVYFRTSAWSEGDELLKGMPRIKPDDVWDHNTYSEPVHIASYAAGWNLGIDDARLTPGPLDLARWRAETRAAGNAFDVHSRSVPVPTEPKVFVFANEFEAGRGHVVVYNWGKADAVTVNLGPILRRGARYTVCPATRSFDKAVVQGTYQSPVSIPMNGEAFGAFLVRAEADSAPVSNR